MFRRKEKSEYQLLLERVKTAEAEQTPIEALDLELMTYLEERMTGTFIILGMAAIALLMLHLLGEQALFRTLLFALIWKGIDAWSRPYFQPFINYRLKKLFSGQ